MIFDFGWKSTYQSKILKFNVSFALELSPHTYCFLAWGERMESRTENTLPWNTIVIGNFLNLGSVSHECCQYQFLRDDNVTKGWRDFFQQESHQRVLRESRSFM